MNRPRLDFKGIFPDDGCLTDEIHSEVYRYVGMKWGNGFQPYVGEGVLIMMSRFVDICYNMVKYLPKGVRLDGSGSGLLTSGTTIKMNRKKIKILLFDLDAQRWRPFVFTRNSEGIHECRCENNSFSRLTMRILPDPDPPETSQSSGLYGEFVFSSPKYGDYHGRLGLIMPKAYKFIAIENFKYRRDGDWHDADQVRKKASGVFVTREDSLKAGNCETHTDLFAKSNGLLDTAVRGDALLDMRDDDYTRRAVWHAIKRYKKNKEYKIKS